MNSKIFLSVVIPAYNEEKRIGHTLSCIYKYLNSQNYDYEVIVVDDGSGDTTVKIAENSDFAREGVLKVMSNNKNKGKGFSVREGVKESIGDYVLFTDADLSTPIDEIKKLLAYTDKGCDIAIGSRSIKDSDVRKPQPWYRQTMGKIFNLFVKIILMKDFSDTQCGFKLFKGEIAREIACDLRINGFCFDVEMLYLAKKKGYGIKEVGIIWNNSPESKVKVIDSSINMFLDFFRIKRIHK